MTFKIPKTFAGKTEEEMEKSYYKIINEVEKSEGIKTSGLENKVEPVILPSSGNLRFVIDENEYKEIVKYLDKTFSKHKNNFSKNLKFEDNAMKGSSTYIATGVDMFLKSINSEYRLATQLDLEQNLNFTTGTYNDSGLALRNLTEANEAQAVYLFNQLKQKGISEKDFPIWFNLRGLNLDNNLNFNLTDETFYSTAECLNWANGTNFSKINNFGLPKEKDNNSSRQIFTSNNALSGGYLGSYSNLISGNSYLSDSNGDGRVVFAKALRA